MPDLNDPVSLAILDLEAESKAMQTMVAFLVAASPEAFANLQQLEPVLGDLAIQFQLTDRQIVKLQETVSRTLEQVRRYQSALKK